MTNNLCCSEERTSSTHALTMYRHNTNHKGQDYKIGKSNFSFYFEQTSGTRRARTRSISSIPPTTTGRKRASWFSTEQGK